MRSARSRSAARSRTQSSPASATTSARTTAPSRRAGRGTDSHQPGPVPFSRTSTCSGPPDIPPWCALSVAPVAAPRSPNQPASRPPRLTARSRRSASSRDRPRWRPRAAGRRARSRVVGPGTNRARRGRPGSPRRPPAAAARRPRRRAAASRAAPRPAAGRPRSSLQRRGLHVESRGSAGAATPQPAGHPRQRRALHQGEDHDQHEDDVEQPVGARDVRRRSGWSRARSAPRRAAPPRTGTPARATASGTAPRLASTDSGRATSSRTAADHQRRHDAPASRVGRDQQAEQDEQPDLRQPGEALGEAAGRRPVRQPRRCPAPAPAR